MATACGNALTYSLIFTTLAWVSAECSSFENNGVILAEGGGDCDRLAQTGSLTIEIGQDISFGPDDEILSCSTVVDRLAGKPPPEYQGISTISKCPKTERPWAGLTDGCNAPTTSTSTTTTQTTTTSTSTTTTSTTIEMATTTAADPTTTTPMPVVTLGLVFNSTLTELTNETKNDIDIAVRDEFRGIDPDLNVTDVSSDLDKDSLLRVNITFASGTNSSDVKKAAAQFAPDGIDLGDKGKTGGSIESNIFITYYLPPRPPVSAAEDDDSTGSIVGAVIGGLFGLALLAIVLKFRQGVIEGGGHSKFSNYSDHVDNPAFDVHRPRTSGINYIERSQLTLITKIGSGQYGDVWKATMKVAVPGVGVTEMLVAVKSVKSNAPESETIALLAEAALMAKVPEHDSIASVLGAVSSDDGGELLLVLTYCDGGSVLSKLKAGGLTTGPEKLKAASQVAAGMAHLERHGVVHRDLAARNVLIDSHGNMRVADFGMSRARGSTTATDDTGVSGGASDGVEEIYCIGEGSDLRLPVRWTAPECLMNKTFSSRSDVWSFAVFVGELFHGGARPYPQLTNAQVQAQTNSGHRMAQMPGCPDAVYSLLLQCWDADSAKRPSFTELAILFRGFAAQVPASPTVPETSEAQTQPVDPYVQPTPLSNPHEGSYQATRSAASAGVYNIDSSSAEKGGASTGVYNIESGGADGADGSELRFGNYQNTVADAPAYVIDPAGTVGTGGGYLQVVGDDEYDPVADPQNNEYETMEKPPGASRGQAPTPRARGRATNTSDA